MPLSLAVRRIQFYTCPLRKCLFGFPFNDLSITLANNLKFQQKVRDYKIQAEFDFEVMSWFPRSRGITSVDKFFYFFFIMNHFN
jgi:hypothetical protein